MSVLKLKDENGNWVGIPTIKGDKGDDGTNVEGNPNGAATDGDLIKIKIDSKIYSIHDYTNDINGKLDKSTTTGYYAYTHDSTTQGELTISQSNDGSTLVQRNSAGRISATYPTATEHCATKGYVDDKIPHLYMHTIHNGMYGIHSSDFTFTFYSTKGTKYTTTGELYSSETNLHDKWIVASGYVFEEGVNHIINAASITTAGISYTYSSNNSNTSYSGSIQDDVVQIF